MEKQKKENVLVLCFFSIASLRGREFSCLWRSLRLHASFFVNMSYFAYYLPLSFSGQGCKTEGRKPFRSHKPTQVLGSREDFSPGPEKELIGPANCCSLA